MWRSTRPFVAKSTTTTFANNFKCGRVTPRVVAVICHGWGKTVFCNVLRKILQYIDLIRHKVGLCLTNNKCPNYILARSGASLPSISCRNMGLKLGWPSYPTFPYLHNYHNCSNFLEDVHLFHLTMAFLNSNSLNSHASGIDVAAAQARNFAFSYHFLFI